MSAFTQTSTTKKFRLGTVKSDVSGNEFRYVKAGAAITANQMVKANGSALAFDDVRPASAGSGCLGVAQVAIASGSYGWILKNGVGSVTTAGSVAVGTVLTTGASGAAAAAAATDLSNAYATVMVNSATPQVCMVNAN
jgi:hypothetical protein